MEDELKNKTDEELKEIVRRAENAHIQGSRHNRALIELDIRHKERVELSFQSLGKNIKTPTKTTKHGFKDDNVFVETRHQGEDQHILMGKRDGTSNKAHVILDAKSGEQRVEDGSEEPTEFADLETIATFKDGKKVKITREKTEQINILDSVKVELEKVDYNVTSRTFDKIADNFSVGTHILVKNLSSSKMILKNVRASLETPEGYHNSLFHSNVKLDENIASQDFISHVFLFSINIDGRHNGGANAQNPVWNENKAKIINAISSMKFNFKFNADCVFLHENKSINEVFDITSQILPQIITT